MTIDTNELRRLAQAATPGPWYVTGKLTRYVEARIDGGLIQEVAACGPTKADGGYGPQQEANARLIAAANPATISELLDRLEAAEREAERMKQIVEAQQSGNEADELRIHLSLAKEELNRLRSEVIHWMEQKEPGAAGWGAIARNLRARIEEMEKQEPVAFALYSGFERKAVYLTESEACDQRDRRQLSADLGGSLESYRVAPLYLAPGAQPYKTTARTTWR